MKYQTRLLKNNGNLPALDVNDSYIVDALVNEGVFVTSFAKLGYSEKVKRLCLHLYVEGNGFRRIERLTKVNHNTVINWVRTVGNSIPSQPDYEEIPEVAQIDELQT